ncbi:MAG TPA: HD domain-containing protein [Candidatus Saccharimonadales bacterium]|nr:HD domain-containing protein [Candidatus Saccharimonadales bacterium]
MMHYSKQDIEALHRKYAPTDAVFALVFTHSTIVADIAAQLIARNTFTMDAELVRVGCLLHDIGVYALYDNKGNERIGLSYITHGIRGEEILKKEGFPEPIWRFASHHTGVGLSRRDVEEQNLPLPVADYVPHTIEERLIMYADKFHSKTSPPFFNTFEWYKQYVVRFGDDKATTFARMGHDFGIPDLGPFIKKYGHQVR